MKKVLLLLLFITIGFACSNDEQFNNLQKKEYELTESEALGVLQGMLSNQAQTRTEISNIYLEAKSKFSVDNNDYPFYHFIVDGKETGFALVSADKRCPEVICYVPKGQLSDTLFNDAAAEIIRMSEFGIAEQIVLNSSRERVGSDSLILLSEVSPILNTTWNQTYPYNALNDATTCPRFANEYYNWKYPVGCQAVATAQVLGHYEKSLGFNINWASLKENPTISASETSKADIIANYMKLIAINLNMSYSCEGGSANTNRVKTYLSSNGISLTNETSSSFNNSAYTWLENGNLIYMIGREVKNGNIEGWHAWLADGYQKYGYGSSNVTTYYLHHNFGWGGEFDGYYRMISTMNIHFYFSGNSKKFDHITYYQVKESN